MPGRMFFFQIWGDYLPRPLLYLHFNEVPIFVFTSSRVPNQLVRAPKKYTQTQKKKTEIQIEQGANIGQHKINTDFGF